MGNDQANLLLFFFFRIVCGVGNEPNHDGDVGTKGAS
jgi:hypothetical protein